MIEKMTPERAIELLKEIAKDDDTEAAHVHADNVLSDLLRALGYDAVVDEYDEIGKWYA